MRPAVQRIRVRGMLSALPPPPSIRRTTLRLPRVYILHYTGHSVHHQGVHKPHTSIHTEIETVKIRESSCSTDVMRLTSIHVSVIALTSRSLALFYCLSSSMARLCQRLYFYPPRLQQKCISHRPRNSSRRRTDTSGLGR